MITISAGRERILLACLLLHFNHTVSLERIVDMIWGQRMPRDPAGQVHSSVYRLRRKLSVAGESGSIVVKDRSGYRIQVGPQDLDLSRFRGLREQARAATEEGRVDVARRCYRAALDLWRGPALGDIDSQPLRDAVVALDEEHLQVREAYVDMELDLGRSESLVADLTDLVRQHPFRERLHGALMRALYQTGRQADALATYRRLRQRLREELGTEPGAELQRVHQRILNHDNALDRHRQRARSTFVDGSAMIPRELPADVYGFTGRDRELSLLDGLLPAGQRGTGPVVISAIAGTAGVGKTALAVHWSHQVADRFPDGQLYVNLRGYAVQSPLRPVEALDALLRSLGTPPEQVPTDETQAANLYRSQLAGRRVLIVLDNARTVEQVRPLLPGSPGCLVLVTSRDRLSGLVARYGVRRITLDMLTEDEAHALLTAVLGTERVQAEPAAAAKLAHLCGYLPLALRIAAANLLDCPTRTIADYVAELAERGRVAALELQGDSENAVWAAFDSSYRSIPADAQRMFRLLGLLSGTDFTPDTAAALGNVSTDHAQRLLGLLAAAHLIEEHLPGRYTFHDLMREYARARADQDEAKSDVRTATQQLLSWYLHTTDVAVDLLYPSRFGLARPAWDTTLPAAPFAESAGALTWLNSELTNLVIAVSSAAQRGPFAMSWLLADGLCRFLMFGGHRAMWQTVAGSALAAAERCGDSRSQAAMHYSLAQFYLNTNNYVEAESHANAILALVRPAIWPECEAEALILLAGLFWRRGQLSEAVDPLSRALEIFRKTGDLASQSVVLSYLGVVEGSLGRLPGSIDHNLEALALSRKLGIRNREILALQNLGVTMHLQGLLDDARERLEAALVIAQELGDLPAEAGIQETLAAIHRDAGRYPEALMLANRALDLSREMDDQRCAAESLNTLASIQLRLGDHERAMRLYQEALDLARATGDVGPHTDALLGLACAYHAHGDGGEALENTRLALDLARGAGYRVLEGLALVQLGEISLGRGRYEDSRRHVLQGLEYHRTSGHRLGEARALAVLGQVARAGGDLEAAAAHRRAARDLYLAIGAAPPEEVPVAVGGQEPV